MLVGDATAVELVVLFKKGAEDVVGDGAHGDIVGLKSVGLVNSDGVALVAGPSDTDVTVMLKAEDSTEADMSERIDETAMDETVG